MINRLKFGCFFLLAASSGVDCSPTDNIVGIISGTVRGGAAGRLNADRAAGRGRLTDGTASLDGAAAGGREGAGEHGESAGATTAAAGAGDQPPLTDPSGSASGSDGAQGGAAGQSGDGDAGESSGQVGVGLVQVTAMTDFPNVGESETGESIGVAAAGNAVPSFQDQIQFPEPLVLTAPSLPESSPDGTIYVSSHEDLTLTWDLGAPGVTFELMSYGLSSPYLSCAPPSEQGTLTIPASVLEQISPFQKLDIYTYTYHILHLHHDDVYVSALGGVFSASMRHRITLQLD